MRLQILLQAEICERRKEVNIIRTVDTSDRIADIIFIGEIIYISALFCISGHILLSSLNCCTIFLFHLLTNLKYGEREGSSIEACPEYVSPDYYVVQSHDSARNIE